MNDLIRRQDVIDALEQRLEDDYLDGYELLKYIKDLPSAELEERTAKVSNQIFNNSNPYTVGAWIGTCECGELVSYSSKYCHVCGARLDWGE